MIFCAKSCLAEQDGIMKLRNKSKFGLNRYSSFGFMPLLPLMNMHNMHVVFTSKNWVGGDGGVESSIKCMTVTAPLILC